MAVIPAPELPSLTNKKILTDRDRMVNADRLAVARLCVMLFNAVQNHPRKEEQLLAFAAAFLLMAEAADIPAQEAFTAVKNLMADPWHSERVDHRFAAMRYHLQTELYA